MMNELKKNSTKRQEDTIPGSRPNVSQSGVLSGDGPRFPRPWYPTEASQRNMPLHPCDVRARCRAIRRNTANDLLRNTASCLFLFQLPPPPFLSIGSFSFNHCNTSYFCTSLQHRNTRSRLKTRKFVAVSMLHLIDYVVIFLILRSVNYDQY